MSYIIVANEIFQNIKETEDEKSLISIDFIQYDRSSCSLIVTFRYQLISKDRKIYYTVFIKNINDIKEIQVKTNKLINDIINKNNIRLKI